MTAPALTRISAQDAESEKDRLFEGEVVYQYPQITMSTVVTFRGRQITIQAADMNANDFCDLLDKRFGPPSATPTPAATPGTPPVCPYHGPMKESTIKGKEGTFYCPKKMADGTYCKERG